MLLFSLIICIIGLMGFTIYGVYCIYKIKDNSKLVINMKDIDYGKPKKSIKGRDE